MRKYDNPNMTICKQVTRQVVPYLKVIRYHITFTMDTKDIFLKKNSASASASASASELAKANV